MNFFRKSLAVESGSAVVVWGHFILRVSAELTSFHIRVDLGSFAIGRQMQQLAARGQRSTLALHKSRLMAISRSFQSRQVMQQFLLDRLIG